MKQPGKKQASDKQQPAYSLSRKAEEDIIDIFLWGEEHFGLKQAEHYHSLLEKSFQFLCENPFAARERTEISPSVRIHPLESHIIVYIVDEHAKVFIIRIRHKHEDWESVSR